MSYLCLLKNTTLITRENHLRTTTSVVLLLLEKGNYLIGSWVIPSLHPQPNVKMTPTKETRGEVSICVNLDVSRKGKNGGED